MDGSPVRMEPSSPSTAVTVSVALITLGLMAASRRSGLPVLWERGFAGLIVIALALVVPVVGWIVIALFAAVMMIAMVAEAGRLAAESAV